MPYGGGYSGLSSKNNRLHQYNFIRNPKKGAILIEFAFAVPVLFSLIYYIQDLATIKRWHSKLDFSLHCAANMFQNTPNITKTDFVKIAYISAMGLFGDPEHFVRPALYPESPLVLHAFYVTGLGNNTCKINWCVHSCIRITGDHYNSQVRVGEVMWSHASRFRMKNILLGSNYSVTELDPSLSINMGETKIILELSVYKVASEIDFNKDYFKLFLAKVSPVFSVGSNHTFMNHIIIFTPKPGTFDPNNPPQ